MKNNIQTTLKLNPIFTSHMVFPARKPIRIYGEGQGEGEVSFADQTQVIQSKNNHWIVEFPPMEYGGPYELKFSSDDKEVVFDDIYIGEVYLFAGQSNMQFKMRESNTAEEMYTSNNMLRLFSTDRIEEGEHFSRKDGWVVCEKESVSEWSALAYLTSQRISKSKNVPVGAITCYQGASVIESWVPENAFKEMGIDIPTEKLHPDHTDEQYSQWNKPGKLYNECLAQIIPYSLTGIIWYQGESDTSDSEAKVYDKELLKLIDIWREDFRDSNLPFTVVQIADFNERNDEGWAILQKAQEKTAREGENVTLVKSRDISENNYIHPPTKDKLAERIASAILG